jgi:hypothetical protein
VGWNATAFYLGIGGGNWANTGVIIPAAYVLCTQFGERNRRYFSRREKVIVVAGFLVIDLLLWLVRSFLTLGAMARDQGGVAYLSYSQLALSATFVLGFHLLAFLAVLAIVERRLQSTGAVGG